MKPEDIKDDDRPVGYMLVVFLAIVVLVALSNCLLMVATSRAVLW